MNSRSNEKHKYSTIKDYALFDGHGSKIKSSFDDSDIFATGNVAEDLWDGKIYLYFLMISLTHSHDRYGLFLTLNNLFDI